MASVKCTIPERYLSGKNKKGQNCDRSIGETVFLTAGIITVARFIL